MSRGLTLKTMSERTGVPFSTLSKVEHDRLTLTYDKLLDISERLGIPISDLFADTSATGQAGANSRRSLANKSSALQVQTPCYDYFYMSPELRNKAMIPILVRVRARDIQEFGALIHHSGEEYFHVIEGRVVVHTEFYEPIELGPGEAVYIDSTMGHGYVLAGGCADATALCVCSTTQEELISETAALRNDAQHPAVVHRTPGRRGRLV